MEATRFAAVLQPPTVQNQERTNQPDLGNSRAGWRPNRSRLRCGRQVTQIWWLAPFLPMMGKCDRRESSYSSKGSSLLYFLTKNVPAIRGARKRRAEDRPDTASPHQVAPLPRSGGCHLFSFFPAVTVSAMALDLLVNALVISRADSFHRAYRFPKARMNLYLIKARLMSTLKRILRFAPALASLYEIP